MYLAAGWERVLSAGSFLSPFTMHIRHAFHTLNDVERRLGPRFAGRLTISAMGAANLKVARSKALESTRFDKNRCCAEKIFY